MVFVNRGRPGARIPCSSTRQIGKVVHKAISLRENQLIVYLALFCQAVGEWKMERGGGGARRMELKILCGDPLVCYSATRIARTVFAEQELVLWANIYWAPSVLHCASTCTSSFKK